MYNQLSAASKTWVYQSNRAFSTSEVEAINESINEFTREWAAHGSQLKAWGEVKHQYFIVLMVDESQHQASGCSIDSSVHFIKSLEQKYAVNLFDRLKLAYKDKEGALQITNRSGLMKLLEAGEVDKDTIVFNNLVQSKGDLESKWEVRLEESWAAPLLV